MATDPRLTQFLEQLRAQLGSVRVHVDAHRDDADPSVQWFVWLLDVAPGHRRQLKRRAWEIADEVFGPDSVPLLLSTVDYMTTHRHFGLLQGAVTIRESIAVRADAPANADQLAMRWGTVPIRVAAAGRTDAVESAPAVADRTGAYPDRTADVRAEPAPDAVMLRTRRYGEAA